MSCCENPKYITFPQYLAAIAHTAGLTGAIALYAALNKKLGRACRPDVGGWGAAIITLVWVSHWDHLRRGMKGKSTIYTWLSFLTDLMSLSAVAWLPHMELVDFVAPAGSLLFPIIVACTNLEGRNCPYLPAQSALLNSLRSFSVFLSLLRLV